MPLAVLILNGCTADAPKAEISISPAPSPTPHTTTDAQPLQYDPPPAPLKKGGASGKELSYTVDVAGANKYRQLGLQYRNQELYDRAIASLQKSIALNPQNISSYVILGWTQHLAGNSAPATQTLKQALKLEPKNVPALNALGIVYLFSGDLQAAVATLSQASTLQPDNEIPPYNLSLAYHRLKQYDLAVKNASRATQLEPNNPHPWVALALAHWDKGEKPEAKKAYRRAIDLDSRYSDRDFLTNLQQAGFSLDQIHTVKQILSK